MPPWPSRNAAKGDEGGGHQWITPDAVWTLEIMAPPEHEHGEATGRFNHSSPTSSRFLAVHALGGLAVFVLPAAP